MEYLDFELPIKELEEQLDKCVLIGQESEIDVTDTCKQINEKLEEVKKNIYGNLTSWQRVQLSRHPNRPYTLDHINALCGDTFLELHGDRGFKDDKAMVGGLGKIGGQSFMVIGQQKGFNTKTRQFRNFGMANPEGYRKALRLMKMAEKFGIPVLRFHYKWSDQEIMQAKHMQDTFEEMIIEMGGIPLGNKPGPETNYGLEAPGKIIHEVGTIRMGDDPKKSALNKYCQAHDCKNLFVVDAGPFVQQGDKNATWTILALSMRTAEYILAEKKRQNL